MSFSTFIGHGLIHGVSHSLRPAVKSLEIVGSAAFPLEVPNIETVFDLYRTGWIDEAAVDTFARMQGVFINLSGTLPNPVGASATNKLDSLWQAVLWHGQEWPTLDEFGKMTNRGYLAEKGWDSNMQLLGYRDPLVISALNRMRYEVPGPSDLVRFAVRHVFEPSLVQYLGYTAERAEGPFLLDIFHATAGLNYPIFTGPLADTVVKVTGKNPADWVRLYTDVGLNEPTWADAYWWAHWVLPSPSQGYEMLFRLRPDRDHRFDPPGTSQENFSLGDLRLLLRANDYPPFWREKLAAIAYRIPGIRFMRQLLHTGVFDAANLYELLLRQGYSPGDAQVLTESMVKNEAEQQRKVAEAKAKGKLASYWELGIIDDAQYVADLTAAGMDPNEAQETLNLARVDYQYKRVKGIVAYVRKQFTSGRIDLGAAREALQGVGIVGPRIEDYLHDWGLQLARQGKEATAAKIVKWACDGFLTINDLATRLGNLGYAVEDVDAFVKEATLCQQGRVAKAAAQAAKTLAQQQRAAQAAVRAQTAQLRAARKALSSHGTPAQLRKWFCEGLIGSVEVYERLNFLGWPDADISRLIGDCKAGTGTGRGGPRSPIGGGTGAAGPGQSPAGG